jgi:calcium/calmodulin-dependent protein kinase I
VVEATDTVRNRKVAVKAAWTDSPEMREILREEYNILRALRHPHVVLALDFIEEGDERPLLVLQRAKGPALSALLSASPLSEAVAKTFTRQLCDALAYIHSAGCVHRDVKPDNILVEEIAGASLELASIILIDFNVAKNTGNNSSDMVTVTGTPEYRAPEVCNNWGYCAKVDIWGLGLTAFAMIAGVLRAAARPVFSYKPLHLATKEELLHHISPDFSGPRWEATTEDCRAFIVAARQILSALRPSAARLLKHPWLIPDGEMGPNAAVKRRLRRTNTAIPDLDSDDDGETHQPSLHRRYRRGSGTTEVLLNSSL